MAVVRVFLNVIKYNTNPLKRASYLFCVEIKGKIGYTAVAHWVFFGERNMARYLS